MNVDTLPKSLPETEMSFDIDLEGLTTKKKFTGTFRVKIPNLRVRVAADKELARLNEGLEKDLSESTLIFNKMVSYLRHVVVESPKWWKDAKEGYDLYDANVVTAVYVKVLEFEEGWKLAIWGADEQPDQRV